MPPTPPSLTHLLDPPRSHAWARLPAPQTFEKLRQLTIFGASEDKGTRRCLAALARSMPWVLIDV